MVLVARRGMMCGWDREERMRASRRELWGGCSRAGEVHLMARCLGGGVGDWVR